MGRISSPTSLAGRTVLVTRAAAQAADLRRALENYGARVHLFPVIEIVAPESYDELDSAINNLANVDWIVFTSVNAVDHFMRRFEHSGRDLSDIDDVRVCAIGDATANRLGDVQVHVDVVPADFSAEGIYAALRNYFGGEEALRNLHFLLPRAAQAREHLPEVLRACGARVSIVTAYRTIRPTITNRGRVEAMLRGGAIDCITFTSGSSVTNFADVFAGVKLTDLLYNVAIACLGETSIRVLARHELAADICPPLSTIDAFADSIAAYFDIAASE